MQTRRIYSRTAASFAGVILNPIIYETRQVSGQHLEEAAVEELDIGYAKSSRR